MNENVILECQSLTKKYGNFYALSNLDLTLEKGQIVGLLRPNGSGKEHHTDQAHQRAAHADCRSGHDPTDGALSGNEKDRFLSS